MTFNQWFLHVVIGLIFAGTGAAILKVCNHRGFIPHPKWQVPLVIASVMLEAAVMVPIVG